MKKIDTKTILINMAKRNDGILDILNLRDFMRFLYQKLAGQKMLDEYNISFDLNCPGIEKTVLESKELSMDSWQHHIIVDETKNPYDKYKVDDLIDNIIDEFHGF